MQFLEISMFLYEIKVVRFGSKIYILVLNIEQQNEFAFFLNSVIILTTQKIESLHSFGQLVGP